MVLPGEYMEKNGRRDFELTQTRGGGVLYEKRVSSFDKENTHERCLVWRMLFLRCLFLAISTIVFIHDKGESRH